jgi:NitT/TauT family transport system permease protein
LFIAIYLVASGIRLAANPRDKLLPSPTSLGAAISQMAFQRDERTGDLLLWQGTVASLRRLAIGLGCATLAGLVFGIAPFLVRDLAIRVRDLPTEQLIKAQTLGASTWQIVLRVILPQVLPRQIDAVRLSLGPAWLFLIAAEAIAATEGLGYRIFLVRRYLSMDIIIPYVVWITVLAFALDLMLREVMRRAFAWTDERSV